VFPVRYELGFYIPGDANFHSHRRENLKSYTFNDVVSTSNPLIGGSTVASYTESHGFKSRFRDHLS
jgi:hypothetical protein